MNSTTPIPRGNTNDSALKTRIAENWLHRNCSVESNPWRSLDTLDTPGAGANRRLGADFSSASISALARRNRHLPEVPQWAKNRSAGPCQGPPVRVAEESARSRGITGPRRTHGPGAQRRLGAAARPGVDASAICIFRDRLLALNNGGLFNSERPGLNPGFFIRRPSLAFRARGRRSSGLASDPICKRSAKPAAGCGSFGFPGPPPRLIDLFSFLLDQVSISHVWNTLTRAVNKSGPMPDPISMGQQVPCAPGLGWFACRASG